MITSSIYAISSASLLLTMYFYPKTSEKQNYLLWIPVCLLLFDCWICLVGGIFSLIHVPADITTISLVNLATAILLFWRIKKIGQIQKFEFKRIDIVFALGLAILIIGIGFIRFFHGDPIVFSTIDPAPHLKASKLILETKSVLSSFPNMYFAEFPNALFMQLLDPVFHGTLSFRAFEIKDLVNLWIAGAIFYSALRMYIRNTFSILLLIVFSLLYVFGYPLNNQLFGFFYLGLSISLIILLQICLKFLLDGTLSLKICTFILIPTLFGLGIAYTFFVPPVFIATFVCIALYLIRKYRMKTLLSGKGILRFGATQLTVFVVPTILIVLFTMVIGRVDGITVGSSLTNEGALYRNLFMDFLPYLPFALFMVCHSIRNRVFDFTRILTPIFFIYTIYFFIQMYLGNISTYYYYKLNFVIWFIVIFLAALAVDKLIETAGTRNFILCYFAVWAVVGFLAVSEIDTKLNEKNGLMNPNPGADDSFMIYWTNFFYLRHDDNNVIDFDWDYVDVCAAAAEAKQSEGFTCGDNIVIISDRWEDALWVKALVDEPLDYKEGLPNDDAKIWIVNKASQLYLKNKELIDGQKKLYENNYGFVILAP
jgi:hypothetical protein